MLTSAVRPDDASRCRRLGIATHVTKPIKQSDLLDAIVSLFARHGSEPEVASAMPADPPARPLRILLAEDNHVNRTLATRVLEKRGHEVVNAVNGREAVDRLAHPSPPFDLVLMDVQMPELDGLSATVSIRQRERTTGGARAHCRDDGACDDWRPRAVSRGRHGRLPLEADPAGRSRQCR